MVLEGRGMEWMLEGRRMERASKRTGTEQCDRPRSAGRRASSISTAASFQEN